MILLLGIVAAISGPLIVGAVWQFLQKRREAQEAKETQK